MPAFVNLKTWKRLKRFVRFSLEIVQSLLWSFGTAVRSVFHKWRKHGIVENLSWSQNDFNVSFSRSVLPQIRSEVMRTIIKRNWRETHIYQNTSWWNQSVLWTDETKAEVFGRCHIWHKTNISEKEHHTQSNMVVAAWWSGLLCCFRTLFQRPFVT